MRRQDLASDYAIYLSLRTLRRHGICLGTAECKWRLRCSQVCEPARVMGGEHVRITVYCSMQTPRCCQNGCIQMH